MKYGGWSLDELLFTFTIGDAVNKWNVSWDTTVRRLNELLSKGRIKVLRNENPGLGVSRLYGKT